MKLLAPSTAIGLPTKTLTAAGVLAAFLTLASIQVLATTSGPGTTLDPVFCSPSALHTTVEPPETQLTRDNAAVRLLLIDIGDHSTQIRKIYTGEIHVAASSNSGSRSLQRGNHSGLFKPDYQRNPWNGSLRQEAERLDRERGTEFAVSVERSIDAGDREAIEEGLRAIFAGLLGDLLIAIEGRLDTSANIERALQYARGYYSAGLDAYLSINAAEQARRASYSLDAMAKAAEDIRADKPGARVWFTHERLNFVTALSEGLHTRVKQPQRL
jgi:hypothetical protein